jgi:hypothetical protein
MSDTEVCSCVLVNSFRNKMQTDVSKELFFKPEAVNSDFQYNMHDCMLSGSRREVFSCMQQPSKYDTKSIGHASWSS